VHDVGRGRDWTGFRAPERRVSTGSTTRLRQSRSRALEFANSILITHQMAASVILSYIIAKIQEIVVSIPTQEDAHLMVDLFKLRLDPFMQQSETWFVTKFEAGSWEDVKARYPEGSTERRMLATILGYWEMLGALVDHNLLSEDLLFDALESMDTTWESVKDWVPTARTEGTPDFWENVELLTNRHAKWLYTRIPKNERP